jgi:TrmH family RNA methyltransferase
MTLASQFQAARKDSDLAVLEGFHALKHALRFKAKIDVALSPGKNNLLKLAENLAPDLVDELKDLVREVSVSEYQKLAPFPPRSGVIAIAKRPKYKLEDVLKMKQKIVLLDNPKDLANIGAVIRVSAAARVAGVLTTGPSDPWNPAAIRGSAGLHFALPVIKIKPEQVINSPRPMIGLDERGQPLTAQSLPKNAILVFGSERAGISKELRENLTDIRRIVMREGVSSLNLATAVAITLYNP